MFKLFASAFVPRILRFRKEVVLLWKAFRLPTTPLYLKLATVAAALYLINPFDIIPEVIPFIGIVDDIIIVPLIVSWIVSRLPQTQPQYAYARSEKDGPVIEGTARRR